MEQKIKDFSAYSKNKNPPNGWFELDKIKYQQSIIIKK
jgi:hypothetical protein